MKLMTRILLCCLSLILLGCGTTSSQTLYDTNAQNYRVQENQAKLERATVF